MGQGRVGGGKAGCEDCYFARKRLCALTETGPCSTYRPDHPEGLRPPRQMQFTFRQERRMQVAWSFPTAQQQHALHT